MQSGEMPLLFKVQFSQTWTNVYEKYYGQKGGWMAGFVLLSFNLQFGQGRNSFSLAFCNLNMIASWNARKFSKKVVEMPSRAPQVQMACMLCDKPATSLTPICEDCVKATLEAKGARGTN